MKPTSDSQNFFTNIFLITKVLEVLSIHHATYNCVPVNLTCNLRIPLERGRGGGEKGRERWGERERGEGGRGERGGRETERDRTIDREKDSERFC